MATVLLLHGDGADGSTTLVDSSSAARTFTANGNAKISSVAGMFGGSAIALDGNGDFFTGTASSDLAFGTGDFTVAFFAQKSANGVNGYDVPICTYSGTSGATGWWVELSSSRGFLFAGGAGTPYISYATNPNDGVRHHWAVCRSGTTLRLFRDGVVVATKTDSTSYPQAALLIGTDGYSEFFNGHIEELLVLQGEAIYTADFTPPTAPYGSSGASGTGVGTLGFTGAGVAVHGVSGMGAGTLDFGGEGIAVHEVAGVTGVGVGTLGFSGAGVAVHGVSGAGAGALSFGGVGAAVHGVVGAGAGSLGFSGQSVAQHLRYEARGEVRMGGALVNRRVRCYKRATGELVGQADTVAGRYRVHAGFNADEVYTMAIDLSDGATDWLPPTANRLVPVLADDTA